MGEKGAERDVYEAIANPTRRKLLRLLAKGAEIPLHELTAQFQMGRTAVSKHLTILNEADLVRMRRVGRETRYRLNAKPLKEIQDWVSFYEGFWQERMGKLKLLLEEQNMAADVTLHFQYESTMEKVWNALTESDMLEKWIWENDFKPVVGHKFQFRDEPNEWWDGIVNGEVLEVDEPHKLSYTWESAGEKTMITWTLKEGSDDTVHLHFEQTGFSEATKAQEGALEGATYAWTNFGDQLEKVLSDL